MTWMKPSHDITSFRNHNENQLTRFNTGLQTLFLITKSMPQTARKKISLQTRLNWATVCFLGLWTENLNTSFLKQSHFARDKCVTRTLIIFNSLFPYLWMTQWILNSTQQITFLFWHLSTNTTTLRINHFTWVVRHFSFICPPTTRTTTNTWRLITLTDPLYLQQNWHWLLLI